MIPHKPGTRVGCISEYYRDASPAQAVADTETLIKEVEAIGRASRQGIWLATAGGGQSLGLPVGTFEPGQAFDLQVVDVKRRDSDLTGFGVFDAPADRLARILYLATPDNVRKVYVQGRLVRDKDAE